jgi:hypothetical protein
VAGAGAQFVGVEHQLARAVQRGPARRGQLDAPLCSTSRCRPGR